jgi:hypothetical protein
MPFGARFKDVVEISSPSISELGTVTSMTRSVIGLDFLGCEGVLRISGPLGDMGLREGPAVK